mgnify:FL=1
MKISFITTIFNEEKNVGKLLDSLLIQSIKPTELIIVDGGSIDRTVSIIMDYESRIREKNILFKFLIKSGNRSIGRNEAIKNATGDIIVCSDAGCILDKNWLKNITSPFSNDKVEVVAGYYSGKFENIFQKCLIPYALVMPDRIDPKNFLPATRSMAFRKTIWKRANGFPEEYSHNEDFVFANELKKKKVNIYFEKSAIAYWIPRNNLGSAFIMFYKFALGDAEARIFRPKVILIFIRYLLGVILLIFAVMSKSDFILYALYFILFMYILWSIAKNYKYVLDIRAILILPIVQVVSDVAVISGTIKGLLKYGI